DYQVVANHGAAGAVEHLVEFPPALTVHHDLNVQVADLNQAAVARHEPDDAIDPVFWPAAPALNKDDALEQRPHGARGLSVSAMWQQQLPITREIGPVPNLVKRAFGNFLGVRFGYNYRPGGTCGGDHSLDFR